MIPILSLVTSIKDYLEVVHKVIEYDSVNINYTELGSIFTFFLLSVKNCIFNFFNFSWLLKENLLSLPIIVPEISAAMISEISVLDGYFHNAFNFLDTPISYGMPMQNGLIACLEKLTIGIINSFFLFLPTSIAHIITLRRFVMQGLEAGYISGLGTIVGNVFWLASILLGFRFFVIPWLSLDIFRYLLGFILLVKYMWDSYNEKKTGGASSDLTSSSSSFGVAGLSISWLKDVSKRKIFLLNFLLALTEQTSIYPFISNISISPEASVLETFSWVGTGLGTSSQEGISFVLIHISYLLGITLGSLSLLHFSCWFWENPAFNLYMWAISSFKVSTSFYSKILNFTFLYLTMLSAICSIPYYGLDYTITNPLGYVSDDRIIQDKIVLETSFLGSKASDRNTRRNRGRHGRRERWKRRIRKYRTFDASLYDQGIYDLFTIEDLNYGFDRFWLRRKLRNHRVRFRFFPGPWMRSFKKQLAKPRLESYTGPRVEFFRILFEQVYHPSFHAYQNKLTNKGPLSQVRSDNRASFALANAKKASLSNDSEAFKNDITTKNAGGPNNITLRILNKNEQINTKFSTLYSKKVPSSLYLKDQKSLNSLLQKATLRKFVRKFENRVKTSQIMKVQNQNEINIENTIFPTSNAIDQSVLISPSSAIFDAKSVHSNSSLNNKFSLKTFYLNTLTSKKEKQRLSTLDSLDEKEISLNVDSAKNKGKTFNMLNFQGNKFLKNQNFSKKDIQILKYRSLLTKSSNKKLFESFGEKNKGAVPTIERQQYSNIKQNNMNESLMLLHPLKYYLQQEAAFKRKLRYYTPSIFRKFSVENNAPYFRVMMKRYFYNFKPNLRWERTMRVASLRKARRKTTRTPKKLQKLAGGSLASYTTEPRLQELETLSRASDARGPDAYFESRDRNPNLASLTKEVRGEPFSNLSGTTVLGSTGSAIKATNVPTASQPVFNKKRLAPLIPTVIEKASLQKSTSNYSVVSKRASRYRYQIYKDVLQHWYYSPFNRFLLKLDVDSFIRRQPNTHFLTTKEENLLHLRRLLLSEHYNTLRWYTNMEHYRTMKTQLNGGTKSFSSRTYNQQFSGTFKKVRHLFAITPNQFTVNSLIGDKTQKVFSDRKEEGPSKKDSPSSSSNSSRTDVSLTNSSLTTSLKDKEPQSSAFLKAIEELSTISSLRSNQVQPNVLKFDQLLYNEFPNKSPNPLLNPLVIHEELLPEFLLLPETEKNRENLKGYTESLDERLKNKPFKGDNVISNFPETFASSFPTGIELKTKSIGSEEYQIKNQNINLASKESLLSAPLTTNQFGLNKDLVTQSQQIVRQYLIQTRSTREDYIKNLLKEKNYSQLTQFLYKGQKIRGNESITNQRLLNNQEKNYLLTSSELSTINTNLNNSGSSKEWLFNPNDRSPSWANKKIITNKKYNIDELYLTFLKNWKRRVNDQDSLKNYLTRRFEKREKRKQKKEKQLLNKLNRLESWLSFNKTTSPQRLSAPKSETAEVGPRQLLGSSLPAGIESKTQNENQKLGLTKKKNILLYGEEKQADPLSNSILTTGLQKSVLDGLFILNNVDKNAMSLNEKNLWKLLFLSKIKEKSSRTFVPKITSFVRLQDYTLHFNDLKNAQRLKLSADIKTTVQTTRKLINSSKLGQKNSKINKSLASLGLYGSFKKKIVTLTNRFVDSAKYAKNISSNLFKLTDLFKPIKRKSLKDWRQKERVLTKQKRSRKEFKLLNKKTEILSTLIDRNQLNLAFQVPSRKKRDISSSEEKDSADIIQSNFVLSSFKRKRSPQRRARVRRNRGVFKKRTLADTLRKDFSKFLNEKDIDSLPNTGKEKSLLFSTNTQEMPLKQRKSKQRKERFWKQKRSKYSQKRRKYRKRRRYTIVKIRKLNKQFKRIKNQIEIQNWWWQQFIPSIQASNEALWQIEKDKLIQQKLSQLSTSEILERDLLNNQNNQDNSSLQIGNKDFKPLALPEAIRIKQLGSSTFARNNEFLNSSFNSFSQNEANQKVSSSNTQPFREQLSNVEGATETKLSSFDVLNKLYESLFINKLNKDYNTSNTNSLSFGQGSYFTEFLLPNTNLPFYTGWDESLRKLIVTNRMLSRKDAGFILMNQDENQNSKLTTNDNGEGEKEREKERERERVKEFSLSPLQGMNAATTLYWQIPFTTYDPDQFFALGMDGFSPITWRKFLFRHSILKTWLTNKETSNTISFKNSYDSYSNKTNENKNKNKNESKQKRGLIVHKKNIKNFSQFGLKDAFISSGICSKSSFESQTESKKDFCGSYLSLGQKQKESTSFNNTENSVYDLFNFTKYKQQKKAFAISRRLKKRYRRVKKHPRTPVWFPSGPLLNEVLPVHYIYVFYKRSRLPRDRYLKRRLLNVKNLNKNPLSFNLIKLNENSNIDPLSNSFNYDFTLRKRLKPKRKYHLKRDYYSSNVIIPRRFKFVSSSSTDLTRTRGADNISDYNESVLSTQAQTNTNIKKWRPLSPLKIHKPIGEVVKEQLLLRKSAILREQKQRSSKQPNIRIKQLRRRVQRQILRTVWRYRPRSGGFVWPGDYLKLDLVKAPKLQSVSNSNLVGKVQKDKEEENKGKKGLQKRKKKRTLVEWQIQPKKYLYEKHNLKVLKKKLSKTKHDYLPYLYNYLN